MIEKKSIADAQQKQNHCWNHKVALNENLPTLCNDSSFDKTRAILLITILLIVKIF